MRAGDPVQWLVCTAEGCRMDNSRHGAPCAGLSDLAIRGSRRPRPCTDSPARPHLPLPNDRRLRPARTGLPLYLHLLHAQLRLGARPLRRIAVLPYPELDQQHAPPHWRQPRGRQHRRRGPAREPQAEPVQLWRLVLDVLRVAVAARAFRLTAARQPRECWSAQARGGGVESHGGARHGQRRDSDVGVVERARGRDPYLCEFDRHCYGQCLHDDLSHHAHLRSGRTRSPGPRIRGVPRPRPCVLGQAENV